MTKEINVLHLHDELLKYPGMIQKAKLELFKLVDTVEDYKTQLKTIKSNTIREVEKEWIVKGEKSLSTQYKRDLEVELRIRESKAGSLIIPKLKQAERELDIKKLKIEKLENLFKALRAIAYSYENR